MTVMDNQAICQLEKMKFFQFILTVENVKNSAGAFGTTVEAA